MECNNCGTHIGRFDLSPNCKKCGVNLYYSEQEKLLSEDAKRCELEYASFRIFSAKLRAAFIGGKVQIARIIFTVLCIGVLFIPFAGISATIPLYTSSISFSGYGIYSAISGGSFAALISYLKIGVTHDFALKSLLLLVSIGALVIIALSSLLAELLSFTNIKRSAKAICVISAIGALVSVATIIFSFLIKGTANDFTTVSIEVSSGFGGYATFAAFIAMLIINLIIIKRNITPKYKEVDLLRIEMHKKVKQGLVKLDDLPLPVFESEEEKQARLKLEQEDAELEEKEKQRMTAGGGAHG